MSHVIYSVLNNHTLGSTFSVHTGLVLVTLTNFVKILKKKNNYKKQRKYPAYIVINKGGASPFW